LKAHRGAALADFNGDGRIDAVVTALGETAELWQNVSPVPQHWIELRLSGTKSNRDGIGAKVRIGTQYLEAVTTVGYASTIDASLHFGLGEIARIPKIEIRWPSGTVQTLTGVEANQVLTIMEK
jgi:hypothetical protein